MIRNYRSLVFFVLLGLLTLAFSSATPFPEPQGSWVPPIEFDPGDWWARNSFTCPLWKGSLPASAQDLAGSTCSNIWIKTFTSGSIKARRYQVWGPFINEPRYNEIINGVDAAIQKGLSIFGTFAGPLNINIGVVWGVIGDIVQVDDDNSGTKDPCYILFDFPPSTQNYPLLAIQEDIVHGMYRCVEQFHRPTVNAWTNGNEWWRRGTARYFDGLAYQATAAILNRGLYPEEYQHGIPFYQNSDAASLFFHFADGLGGWSPTDVNSYMKGHANKATYDQERTSLSTDSKITSSLFHRFILACKDKTIKYPNGQKIIASLPGPPENAYSVVNINSVGREYTKTIAISAWKGKIHVFPIRAGQKVRVSLDVQTGIEWSIRKIGTAA